MTGLSTVNIRDLDAIYNDAYQCWLPKEGLEKQIAGTAFGAQAYDAAELERGREETELAFQRIIGEAFHVPERAPKTAYVSAGAPGAGKTHVLTAFWEKLGKIPYVDPDAVFLVNSPWHKEVAESCGLSAAYTKLRSISNAATIISLAHTIKAGLPFCYGTTASSPFVKHFFTHLKTQGYQIVLEHVTAPDQVRVGSIHTRDQTFVQTTDEDICEKAILTAERIVDFMTYADVIHFHNRTAPDQPAVLAATWTRFERSGKGTLEIHDEGAYNLIIQTHDLVIDRLKKTPEQKALLYWNDAVESRVLMGQENL